jgi:hypothetical protein
MDRPQGTVVRFRATSSALVKADQNDGRRAPTRRVLNAGYCGQQRRASHRQLCCEGYVGRWCRLKTEGSLTVPDTFELITESGRDGSQLPSGVAVEKRSRGAVPRAQAETVMFGLAAYQRLSPAAAQNIPFGAFQFQHAF